jgi:hypothetical protein
MKLWRVAVAFLFTVLLLVFARKTTMVRSVEKAVEGNGILIEHKTVPKQVGDEIPVISAKVEGATLVKLFYRIGKDGEYQAVEMDLEPGAQNVFAASLPLRPKGIKAWYYLEAVSQEEGGTREVTLPDRSSPDFSPILLRYEGEVPPYVVFPHVLCIFGAIFFAGIGLLSAIDVRRGKGSLRQSVKFPVITFVLLFLGFLPFGIAMNYFAFGATWEAFPFGWDVTDNKSQIMLLFWLFTLLSVKGTLRGRDESKNLVSGRGYSALVLISFIVTLLIIAVPHSL